MRCHQSGYAGYFGNISRGLGGHGAFIDLGVVTLSVSGRGLLFALIPFEGSRVLVVFTPARCDEYAGSVLSQPHGWETPRDARQRHPTTGSEQQPGSVGLGDQPSGRLAVSGKVLRCLRPLIMPLQSHVSYRVSTVQGTTAVPWRVLVPPTGGRCMHLPSHTIGSPPRLSIMRQRMA